MVDINGKTKLLGIIGNPLSHSLSPIMQNMAIAILQLNYVYLPFPVKTENLEEVLKGFYALNLVGFNVTIPHKQTIIPFLSQITTNAQIIGAVNTVWHTDTGWHGTNTDIDGFIAPLTKIERDWSKVTPVILGIGGASRAVVVGCAKLGCPEIHVLARDNKKLEVFEQSWANTPFKSKIKGHSWNKLPELVSTTELLINTTPVGMYPNIKETPINLEEIETIKPNLIVYDLIYNPRPTLLLKQAQKKGLMIIDGVEMLVQQGGKALEIWLQQPAPIDVMRQALLNQLNMNYE